MTLWKSKTDDTREPSSTAPRRSYYDWDDDLDDGAVVGGSVARPAYSSWRSKADAGGSLSSFWSGRFGGFTSTYNTGISKHVEDLVRVLNGLTRVGRIIYQDDVNFVLTDKEVAPDGGTQKNYLKDIIVDIEALKAGDVSWDTDQRIDATMGTALAAAATRVHASPAFTQGDGFKLAHRAFEKTLPKESGVLVTTRGTSLVNNIITDVSKAAEWLYSTSRVVEEFPGYAGYFESDREFRHRESVEKKARKIIADGFSPMPGEVARTRPLESAVAALLWNALAPDKAIACGPEELTAEVNKLAHDFRMEALTAPDNGALQASISKTLSYLANKFEAPPVSEQGGAAQEMGDLGESLGVGEEPGETAENADAAAAENAVMRELFRLDMENPFFDGNGKYENVPISIVSVWQVPNQYEYVRTRTRVFSLIQRVRASLSFRNEISRMDEMGLKSGLLDEAALPRISMNDTRVFRRQEVVSAPSVHIGLMVDESGSMNGCGDRIARECAVLVYEATKNLPGVALSIWGHTANTGFNPEGAEIYRYLERGKGDPNTLGSIQGRANNLDGAAILYAGKRMLDLQRPGESRILFVLADGWPAGTVYSRGTRGGADGYACYGGAGGQRHTRNCIEKTRATGTEVFQLAMGSLDERVCESMYGSGNFIVCNNAQDLPKALSRLLKVALKRGSLR